MLRRNPTRIELRLDDIQEYEMFKKQLEDASKRGVESPEDMSQVASNGTKTSLIASPLKTRSSSTQERLRAISAIASQATTGHSSSTGISAPRSERTASS